jgi:hypothetical protein
VAKVDRKLLGDGGLDGGLDRRTLHVTGIHRTTAATAIRAATVAATVPATVAGRRAAAIAVMTATAAAVFATAAAIAAATAMAEGQGLALTAHEGDTDQGEENRDTQHNDTIHSQILQLLTGTGKREHMLPSTLSLILLSDGRNNSMRPRPANN